MSEVGILNESGEVDVYEVDEEGNWLWLRTESWEQNQSAGLDQQAEIAGGDIPIDDPSIAIASIAGPSARNDPEVWDYLYNSMSTEPSVWLRIFRNRYSGEYRQELIPPEEWEEAGINAFSVYETMLNNGYSRLEALTYIGRMFPSFDIHQLEPDISTPEITPAISTIAKDAPQATALANITPEGKRLPDSKVAQQPGKQALNKTVQQQIIPMAIAAGAIFYIWSQP